MMHTLRSDCQQLTFVLTPTVDTTYCNVVFIACQKISQFILCGIVTGDVQKSSIWRQGSIGGNVDEIANALSIKQGPAESDIHSSTDIFREANKRENGNCGRT